MAEERVQSIALHHEMQRSYLEYAMSVIVGRALPDVRDGLKPCPTQNFICDARTGAHPRPSLSEMCPCRRGRAW
jgi:hypothetical protein